MGMEHLQTRCCGLHALVAMLATRTVGGLLGGVAGKHAEDDRHSVFDAHLGNAVGHRLRDELEVAGLALDDAAETDDGIMPILKLALLVLGTEISERFFFLSIIFRL